MKNILAVILATGTVLLATAKEPIPLPNSYQAGSQHYAYPYRTIEPPVQTAAPKGYEPFHMEHYGRHGSRWHNQAVEYSDAPRWASAYMPTSTRSTVRARADWAT